MSAVVPTVFISLVVVRKDDRFLLVQETKSGHPWYLPAGRVDPGERLVDAAVRETREEAGVPVEIRGVLRFERSPSPEMTRFRAIFLARPTDDTPPKSEPDEESLGAAWYTLDEIKQLNTRSGEVLEFCRYVANGGTVHPLSILTAEGDPLR